MAKTDNEEETLSVVLEFSEADIKLLSRIVNDTDDDELRDFCESLLKKAVAAAKKARETASKILESNPFTFWERD